MLRASPIAVSLLAAAAIAGACPGSARAGEVTRTVLVEMEPAAAPRAARRAGPTTVYLNTEGGLFTPGEPNDSRTNVSSIPDLPVVVDPWEASFEEKQQLLACVSELFAPFGATVTDRDPGEASHLEAVVGGNPIFFGLGPDVAGVSPFLTNCGFIDDSIVFIYPSVVGSDPRRLCETVAQEVAHSFGLDHEYLCQDPMTYLTGCGNKEFLFQDAVCGEYGPRPCKCSRSQNSARLLLDRLGRGESPKVWLSQPSTGDVLAAGFPVQAAVNHAPASLALYVDGVLADTVVPEETGAAYQLIDFDTSDLLRSGTHQVDLVARYGASEERTVRAMVEVEGTEGENVVTEGCAAAGGAGGAGGSLVLLLVGAIRPRRRAFLLLIALAAGCKTTVFGDGPGDIASGCPVAGDVGAAIGVLWSPAGGTCTASLTGPTALVTAAHCVVDAAAAGEPIVSVVGGRQYLADSVDPHPGWLEAPPADDLAVVTTTRAVEGVTPLAIAPEQPAEGTGFTLIGHGAWTPDDPRDAERQAQVGTVAGLEDRSFSYDETADEGCLAGRAGGLLLAGGAPDRILGLHGQDRSIMRLDRYACWLSCGSGARLPAGCDCSRSDWRPCNDCGAEFLDQASRTWSPCEPAEELRPCGEGQVCGLDGYCTAR